MHHSYLKMIIIVFDIRNKCTSPTNSLQLFEFKKESMYLKKGNRKIHQIKHMIVSTFFQINVNLVDAFGCDNFLF